MSGHADGRIAHIHKEWNGAALVALMDMAVSGKLPAPTGDANKLMADAKACTDGNDKLMSGLATMTELPGFIYVASPYSKWAKIPGYGLSRAAGAAAKLTGELMKGGMRCFSPIAHGHYVTLNSYLDPLDHAMWMNQCDGMMGSAAGIIVLQLPGWNESKGVQMEIDHFAKASKPILFVRPTDLLPGFKLDAVRA